MIPFPEDWQYAPRFVPSARTPETIREAFRFSQNLWFGFVRGGFDEHKVAVLLQHDGGWTEFNWLDGTWLSGLYYVAQAYGPDKVVHDVKYVFYRAGRMADGEFLKRHMDGMVDTYLPEDRLAVGWLFTILYFGIIAENNKTYPVGTRCGGVIKVVSLLHMFSGENAPKGVVNPTVDQRAESAAEELCGVSAKRVRAMGAALGIFWDDERNPDYASDHVSAQAEIAKLFPQK